MALSRGETRRSVNARAANPRSYSFLASCCLVRVHESYLGHGTTGNEGQGSRIAVRIESGSLPSRQTAQLLPHKTHGQGSRPALPAEAAASIQLQRLPACANDDWVKALAAAKLWLLAGSLGYRLSRAAGSVWPQEPWAPGSRAALADLLAPLIAMPSQPWGVALVAEELQKSWANFAIPLRTCPAGIRNCLARPNRVNRCGFDSKSLNSLPASASWSWPLPRNPLRTPRLL